MFGKQLTALSIDGISIRIMIESIILRKVVRKKIYLNILTAWDTIGSLTVRTLKREKITGGEL